MAEKRMNAHFDCAKYEEVWFRDKQDNITFFFPSGSSIKYAQVEQMKKMLNYISDDVAIEVKPEGIFITAIRINKEVK